MTPERRIEGDPWLAKLGGSKRRL